MSSTLLMAVITFIAFSLAAIRVFLKYRLDKAVVSSSLFSCFAFLSFSGLALVNLLEKLNTYLNNITHIKGLFLLTSIIFLFSAIYSYQKEAKLCKDALGGGGVLEKVDAKRFKKIKEIAEGNF